MNLFRFLYNRKTCWLLPVVLLYSVVVLGQVGERIPFNETMPDSAFYTGVVAVKIRASAGISFHKNGSGNWQTGNGTLDALLTKLNVTKADTLFANVIKEADANEQYHFLSQMEIAGITRWGRLYFPDHISPEKVAVALQAIKNVVENATPMGKIQIAATPNDAQFAQQWLWQNTGQTGGTVGADVKAVPAWDIETGQPNVLVAVHDGAFETTHPDLAQNTWAGKGFNFVSNNTSLVTDAHGTHVAGIIAAVRNNNVGVAGIAGGSGAAVSGVRMMSLQIVGGTPVNAGHEAQSFIYAANNGAAISQNSWSYGVPNYMPDYTADAIDYFVKNGGGNVLKGGLVVFAAGNYNSENLYYPAPYSKVLAVAASNQFDIRGSYSSYGNWVDITAPGGDPSAAVLSTLPGGGYGGLFGTSMACPVVSGIASLIVSHVPGRLLADDLRGLLIASTDNIYPINPWWLEGKLGSGRINAFKAMQLADAIAAKPILQAVQSFNATMGCNTVTLNWTTTNAATSVVIAMALNDNFIGNPFGKNYAVGDTLAQGGVVVYSGNATSCTLPLPIDGSRFQLRIWATNADGSNYSIGVDTNLVVPQTVGNIVANAGSNQIDLNWQRQCPNSGVLLAFAENSVFGHPVGDPAGIGAIHGGGVALQFGSQTSFTHSGLQPDQSYFYAFYPYQKIGNNWEYGLPQIVSASTACTMAALPIAESFSYTNFAPLGWKVVDGGPAGSAMPDGRTWQRNTLAGSTTGDNASALINAYTQNGAGSQELLRSPAFTILPNSDSVMVSFDYAYRAYDADPGLADSLELVWTSNCGNTLQSIWKAGGQTLASVSGFSTAEFIPQNAGQWRQLRFDLKPLVPVNQPVAIGFRATNKFGQNIWLDNIKVQAYTVPVNDAQVVAWQSPVGNVFCEGAILPQIKLANAGYDTLKTVRLSWMINGVLADSLEIVNLKLASNKDTLISLKPINLTAGNYSFKIFSKNPNGKADEKPVNDTLNYQVAVTGSATDPHFQGFEGQIVPANGWAAAPGNTNWVINATTSRNGSQSVWMNRFQDAAASGSASLFSPFFQPKQNVDSLFLRFALAVGLKNQAGSLLSDTLVISITTNCGATSQVVYRKFGEQLATSAASPDQAFTPANIDWRVDSVNLTPWLSQLSAGFQVVCKLIRGGGNNIYLDDILIYSKKLPTALKDAGFGVYPNPVADQFTVWHLLPSNGLKGMRLLNTAGQVLQKWQWPGLNAPQSIVVNSSRLSNGVYWLQLEYEQFTKIVKVVKY